ncbi:MAG: hypothetical protein ACLU4J_02920 [Butyricimonas paravirosa]
MLVNDPVITEGPRNTTASDGNNDLRLRTYRLNYYAVQALMARVYLYAGRNEDALIMAKSLLKYNQSGIRLYPIMQLWKVVIKER